MFTRLKTPRSGQNGSARPVIEELEQRSLLSGGSLAYAPDAVVEGHSLSRWAAKYWTNVLQTKVHAANGTTFINPMIDDSAPQAKAVGDVTYLFGTILGGDHLKTATVRAGSPIFVPILPTEWDNFSTPTDNVPNGPLPGNNSAAALRAFGAQTALPALGVGGALHLIVDGVSLADPGSYRQIAPTFSYVLPQTDNIFQFFGGPASLKGRVSPAEADGFYVMLKPLSPGKHVIDFGGMTADGPLGALSVNEKYTITVTPNDDSGETGNHENAIPPSCAWKGDDSSTAKHEGVLGRSDGKLF
jgi:hypothetical protein